MAPGVRCPTGEARVTPAFRLPARWVVHTVGPVWRGGGHGERALLARCYRNACRLAAAQGAHRVAFPAIPTGVYGFPIHAAAVIAIGETITTPYPPIEDVLHVCFSPDATRTFRAKLDRQRG